MKKKEQKEEELPVVKLTLDEYHNICDGHTSKRIQRIFDRIGRRMFRYEITDLIRGEPPITDLYFIVHDNFVKIGQSINPYKRLLKFQTGAPNFLKIIAVFTGLGKLESECHKRLKHLHYRGEWFKYTNEVDVLIEELGKKQ